MAAEAGEGDAPPSLRCELFFDPAAVEGSWGQNHRGGVIGHTICPVASLAQQVTLSPDAADISEEVRRGV